MPSFCLPLSLQLRSRPLAGAVALLVLLAMAPACSDTGTATSSANADGLGAGTSDLGLGQDGEPSGQDAAVEATVFDLLGSDSKSCPGGAGCGCKDNSECDTLLCIETPTGKECAQNCTTSCPADYKCAPLPGAGGDITNYCVPMWGKLCNPCSTSQACSALGQSGAACVVHGSAGAFCGVECTGNDSCPTGYQCKEFSTVEGTKAKQCAPQGDGKDGPNKEVGACGCSPAAVGLGLSTSCMAATQDGNGTIGGCPGTRTCTASGLSACTAPDASPEVCDGLDNDCNGKTDEGSCDDGNACTQDDCAPGADKKITCQHSAIASSCDADKSVCTENDTCEAGVCVAGKAKLCDDGNPCTADKCDPVQGCVQQSDDGAPCSDDNPCTIGDLCQNGGCLAGITKTCSSVDACQSAKCNQADGKCVFTDKQDGLPCDDSTLCTSADNCASGACKGTLIACDDGNPCTTDSCDLAKGCTSTDFVGGCSDGNGCTEGDACKASACLPGSAKSCDDGDGCTLDTCNKINGECGHAAIVGCGGNCNTGADCNDSNPCTDDTCAGGKCQVAPNSQACDDKELCTQSDLCAGGVCAGSQLGCDDKNPCTIDTCDPTAGCAHQPSSLGCEDGNACTVGDVCAGGACKPGPGATCDDGNVCTSDACDPKTGVCASTNNTAPCNDNNACTVGDMCAVGLCQAGTPTLCDDGKPCTDDKCDPATGSCVVSNNTLVCTDNNACTTGDVCSGGACKSGTAKVCNDNNACTSDSCNTSTGACVNTPIVGCGGNCLKAADCDDKNPCTTDACTAGKCANTANSSVCEDGNLCTLGDVCAAGACKPGTAKLCNDANPCTDDSCIASTGLCSAANNTLACSDNDACTQGDVCAVGVCKPGVPLACDDKNACNGLEVCKLGACVAGTAVVCDDKNPCTDDSCDSATGKCLTANNTAACTDSNACTTGDICAAGACKPGVALTCNDNNPCTTDACDPLSAKCSNTANTAACTDNTACTVGDICAAGVCKPGTLTVCNDNNQCTTDSCDATTGKCVYTNTTLACSDGSACTTGDKCDGAGKCVPGVATVCKAIQCNTAACNTTSGLCETKPVTVGTACDDLQTCTVGDKCDGAGKCASGPWDNTCGCQTDAACDDKNPCTTDKCVATKCTFTQLSAGTVCDDGNACTTASTCDAKAVCTGTATYDCTPAKGSCNSGLCIDQGGFAACKLIPLTAGTTCSDGLYCTTTDTCDGAGKCIGGPSPLCGKPAQCYTSQCTEAAMGCATAAMVNGTACNDGALCTGSDVCTAGVCKGTLLASCTPVLTSFSPATPSTSTATAGVGTATAGTNVYLYPTSNCTGKPLNPTPTAALPAFSIAFTANTQMCTAISAQAVDSVGTVSACSNSLTFDHYTCSQCTCPASDWIREFGTIKADGGSDVAADAAGNFYVVGSTLGAYPGFANAGLHDGFVAKLDANGNRLWVKQFGTAAEDTAGGVYIDPTGNIWVTGSSAGDIDGAGPGPTPPSGDSDAFVAKYDANGNRVSIAVFGTATRTETPADVTYDTVGARLVVLISSQNVTGGGLSPQVIGVNTTTNAVSKIWEFLDNTQNKNPSGLAVDSAGAIYVAGRSQWAIGGALTTTGADNGGMYVYKVSAAGATVWLQHWGSLAFDLAGGLAVDNAGAVYATGLAQGVAIGTAAGTVYAGSNGTDWGFGGDVVVAAFNTTTGAATWVTQVGTAGGDFGTGIEYVSGKGGGLYVTGHTTGNWDTGAATSKFGGMDAHVIKLNVAGIVAYKHNFGTAADDASGKPSHTATALLIPGTAGADFVGQSADSCNFQGTQDVFVAKFCAAGLGVP